MLDKGVLVTLITAFTAVVFTVWITVDFCLYRKRKAAIRATKADTFYRPQRAERCQQPYQVANNKDKPKTVTPKETSRKLSVRNFMKLFTGKKSESEKEDKNSIKENISLSASQRSINRNSSFPVSKPDAARISVSLSGKAEKHENNAIATVNTEIELNKTKDIESNPSTKKDHAVLSKMSSAPNLTGKWKNVVGPSNIPPGKKVLPPLKEASGKSIHEGYTSFSGDDAKGDKGESVQLSSKDDSLVMEESDDTAKPKVFPKRKYTKAKFRQENDVFSSGSEQSCTDSNTNNEQVKKPPLIKRLSRNRINSINDGSTSSTDTKETFIDEKAATVSSAATRDESRKRTESESDSTTSSGSTEPEKRQFRLKPFKRNQSNMSVCDTTPLT